MAIREVIVRHPFQYGTINRWDEETEGKEAEAERAKGLKELDAALNEEWTVVDSHSVGNYRRHLLHKNPKKEKYIPHPDSPHS